MGQALGGLGLRFLVRARVGSWLGIMQSRTGFILPVAVAPVGPLRRRRSWSAAIPDYESLTSNHSARRRGRASTAAAAAAGTQQLYPS